jgi:hypothetical protein
MSMCMRGVCVSPYKTRLLLPVRAVPLLMRLLVCSNPQLELQTMTKKYGSHIDFYKHPIYYTHLKCVVFQDGAPFLTIFANKFLSSHFYSSVWTPSLT